jgi:hypothetical protein
MGFLFTHEEQDHLYHHPPYADVHPLLKIPREISYREQGKGQMDRSISAGDRAVMEHIEDGGAGRKG